MDGVSIQHRFTDIHDGVVQNPLVKGGRADPPLFGIADFEKTVVANIRMFFRSDLVIQLEYVGFKVLRKCYYLFAIPFAFGRFPEGQTDIVRVVNGFE
jgi:hypothetical protein